MLNFFKQTVHIYIVIAYGKKKYGKGVSLINILKKLLGDVLSLLNILHCALYQCFKYLSFIPGLALYIIASGVVSRGIIQQLAKHRCYKITPAYCRNCQIKLQVRARMWYLEC